MGCSCSADKQTSTRVEPAISPTFVYDRRPKISVRIGDQARKLSVSPQVIFIFGGPGSRKGCVVEELVASYGFTFVSGENLIQQELPRKLANIVKLETVKDVRTLLEDDASHVTLEWVLIMLERRMEQRQVTVATTYIVDFVPNLKYLLRSKEFVKDCGPAMKKFEQRYPVSLALNLAIPADKVLSVCQTVTHSDGTLMKQSGGQGDEADLGRTQRRVVTYEQSVRGFLDYFEASRRLVTVDVTCGVPQQIWGQVDELLRTLRYEPRRSVNRIILFAFDDFDIDGFDHNRYSMERVDLKSLTPNPLDTVEALLSALSGYIDEHSTGSDSFLIMLKDTSVNVQNITQMATHPVVFTDSLPRHMEGLLAGSAHTKDLKLPETAPPFQSVSSLDNDVCLFPLQTSSAVCHAIASLMSANRSRFYESSQQRYANVATVT